MKKTIILILSLLPILCFSQKIRVKVENIDSTGSATRIDSISTDSLYQEYLIFVRNPKIGRFIISSPKKDTMLVGKHKIKSGKKYIMEIDRFFALNVPQESEYIIWNGRKISRKEVDGYYAFYSTDDLIGLYYVR